MNIHDLLFDYSFTEDTQHGCSAQVRWCPVEGLYVKKYERQEVHEDALVVIRLSFDYGSWWVGTERTLREIAKLARRHKVDPMIPKEKPVSDFYEKAREEVEDDGFNGFNGFTLEEYAEDLRDSQYEDEIKEWERVKREDVLWGIWYGMGSDARMLEARKIYNEFTAIVEDQIEEQLRQMDDITLEVSSELAPTCEDFFELAQEWSWPPTLKHTLQIGDAPCDEAVAWDETHWIDSDNEIHEIE